MYKEKEKPKSPRPDPPKPMTSTFVGYKSKWNKEDVNLDDLKIALKKVEKYRDIYKKNVEELARILLTANVVHDEEKGILIFNMGRINNAQGSNEREDKTTR